MEGKPIRAKNLKVIDHLGTLYATFNGSSMWKLDKVAFGILRMCDGKRSVENIVDELSKRISHKPEDVKPVVEEILEELTKMKFIEWV
ncbi:MAG: PqqD family peptide modification chaperone [Candidatus Aenigmatarchaeota archaeon]